MDQSFSPKAFWTDRFRKHGHTGETDPMLYAYDQPRRLAAIDRALARAGAQVTAATRILDFGCGTGDVMASLLRQGGPRITGVDISEDTVRHAQARFAPHPSVTVMVGTAEEMEFEPASFDLAVGINVLQHIDSDASLARTLTRLRAMVRPGGHAIVMDFSPIVVQQRKRAAYVVIRSRQEYLSAFADAGWQHVLEYPLPRIGVRMYRSLNGLLSGLRGGATPDLKVGGSEDRRSPEDTRSPAPPSAARRAVRLLRSAVLQLASPLDALLTPSAPHRADMRIFVFENRADTRAH